MFATVHVEQINTYATPSKCMLVTFTSDKKNLFTNGHSYVINVYTKFQWNLSTKYRDIALCFYVSMDPCHLIQIQWWWYHTT